MCFACDVLLILLSVGNVGWAVNNYPWLHTLLLGGACLFLLWYGGQSILSGIRGQQQTDINSQGHRPQSWWLLVITAISFSLLNPQAIIDTMVMIGGYASQYSSDLKRPFIIGTIMASLLWFWGLTTVSLRFAHVLQSRRAWRILDATSGLLMVGIAVKLGFAI